MPAKRQGVVRKTLVRSTFAAAFMGGPCLAATLDVAVLDERGAPIPRVAVYATRHGKGANSPPVAASAVLDQKQRRFDPHMLVVQKGTSVLFPNSDDVSHHVYSFSAAKSFELGLYKGNVHPPVVFDQPGIVVVGCNIHDSMLAYIVVVDTPFFGVTDDSGKARIEAVPAGDYDIAAWTERARPVNLPPPLGVAVRAEGTIQAALRITGRLAPDAGRRESSLSWNRY